MKNLQQLKEQHEKLVQEIKALEGGRWKPEEGEDYYTISWCGDILPSKWEGRDYDHETYAIGNCYKTREQAQAVIDLKKHIYKFPMPEDKMWALNGDLEWDRFYEEDPRDVIDYHNGSVMHYDATEEDVDERLRLLKLAYNID